MTIGLCTIQRDRGPWIVEWLAFHYVVGFRKFYVYAHLCSDNTTGILARLTKLLDITAFTIDDRMDFVQLKAFQHAYDNYGRDVDWMAFIDGDEFLFPTAADDIRTVMSDYASARISALAAYWVCYGSSWHVKEPNGLIIDNYRYRPPLDFIKNRHVKSIVKGRQRIIANRNAHLFETELGTYDELMRPVTHGFMRDVEPSYTKLRINHYTCQSLEFYETFKRTSGMADAGHALERPEDWWSARDINEDCDTAIDRFRGALVDKVDELNAILAD